MYTRQRAAHNMRQIRRPERDRCKSSRTQRSMRRSISMPTSRCAQYVVPEAVALKYVARCACCVWYAALRVRTRPVALWYAAGRMAARCTYGCKRRPGLRWRHGALGGTGQACVRALMHASGLQDDRSERPLDGQERVRHGILQTTWNVRHATDIRTRFATTYGFHPRSTTHTIHSCELRHAPAVQHALFPSAHDMRRLGVNFTASNATIERAAAAGGWELVFQFHADVVGVVSRCLNARA